MFESHIIDILIKLLRFLLQCEMIDSQSSLDGLHFVSLLDFVGTKLEVYTVYFQESP